MPAFPTIKVGSHGPQPARILIIGEAPGKSEEEFVDPQTKIRGRPFVGSSGHELTKMLNEAEILRSEVRVTNVCKFRPPGNKIEFWWPEKKKDIQPNFKCIDGEFFDPRIVEGLEELQVEIRNTRPNVIIPLGNLPLWATTRETGITKWRSSLLPLHRGACVDAEHFATTRAVKVIPAIHPAAVLRKWDWRYLCVHDFRRAKRWENYEGFPRIEERFLVNGTYLDYRTALEILLSQVQQQPTVLAVDIETSRRLLACFGIAWSRHDALCLPFSNLTGSYFQPDEELSLILLLRTILTHPNARCVGQNWQYDCQYVAKYWGFEVNLFLDIMSEHHVQFPGLPKGLDFQSSLYRDIHVYWKDEGKEMGKGDLLQWWTYNCKDTVATYEIAEVLMRARAQRALKSTDYGSPHEIQQRLSVPISRACMRGVRKDHEHARRLAFMLQEDIRTSAEWINRIVGGELNVASPKQMHKLFYEELAQTKILHRKTHKPTLDGEALDIIARRDVLLRPLCKSISHLRSIKNALSVCLQSTDVDGRIRCQYIIPGTETYRFASHSDPFGYGTNLQNVTSGEEEDTDFPLPNLRRLFIPDESCTLGEFDMPQADARVVAWEAGDEKLIELFGDPSRHLHIENAALLYPGELVKKGSLKYYYAKQGVHLTNYGGTPPVLAKTLGITIHEADKFQKRWFSEHPAILDWHRKVEAQLMTKRFVENAYGYRRFYFDRMEGLLKEALAWIPQSTVAIATNLFILSVTEDPESYKLGIEFLLQVHDSGVFQWPTMRTPWVLQYMLKKASITVPYPRSLIFIPEAKISDKSWGDIEPVKIIA